MTYSPDVNKIDSKAVDGLLGVDDSLAYKVHQLEKHNHNHEHCFGVNVNQTGTVWALGDTLNHYSAISGNGVWGADANDEALVWGLGDLNAGNVKMDFHRIFIKALSSDTPYLIRAVWGTGTMANGVSAGQMSTFMAQNDPSGAKAGGSPIELLMHRITLGTDKVWLQCANATDNATIQFFVLVHFYAG